MPGARHRRRRLRPLPSLQRPHRPRRRPARPCAPTTSMPASSKPTANCPRRAAPWATPTRTRTGLQQLDATIQAETDGKQAVAEYRRIFIDFRIYWLQTPKTHEVVACDRETKADATLTSLEQKIQARVDQAKTKGYDVSGAQA